MGIFMNRRDSVDWFNQQQQVNQQTNLRQMCIRDSTYRRSKTLARCIGRKQYAR